MDDKNKNKNNLEITGVILPSGGLPVEENPSQPPTPKSQGVDPVGQNPSSAAEEKARGETGDSRPVLEPAAQSGSPTASTQKMEVDLQHTASRINRLHLDGKTKLSGAQRRKKAIEEAKARGEEIRPRRKPGKNKTPTINLTGSAAGTSDTSSKPDRNKRTTALKRSHSGGSTPSPTGSKPRQQSKKVRAAEATASQPGEASDSGTGGTYSQTLTALKMAIALEHFPNEKLTPEQGKAIQKAIMDEVWKCEKSTGPQFTNSYFNKGVVFVTCANERSREWLLTKVPLIKPWQGAVLRIGAAKDVVQTARLIVWVPIDSVPTQDSAKILQLIQTQNEGLSTEEWTVVRCRGEPLGTTMVVDIDMQSLDKLKSTGYRVFLGFTQLSFKHLGRCPSTNNAPASTDQPAAQ